MRFAFLFMMMIPVMGGAGVPAARAQQDNTVFFINADSLQGSFGYAALPPAWSFYPGDDPAFADPDFDDSTWTRVQTDLPPDRPLPDGWDGLGWFRLRFRVDPALRGRPFGFRLNQFGASELYLDGQLLYTLGQVGATAAETKLRMQRLYHVFSLDDRDEHVFALRYANHDAERFHRANNRAGFSLYIQTNVNETLRERRAESQSRRESWSFFIGLGGAIALLHLFLFAFYPKAIENLYFALLIGAFIVIAFTFIQNEFSTNPRYYLYAGPLAHTLGVSIGLFALLFGYRVFYDRLPRSFYVAVVLGLAIVGLVWINRQIDLGIGYLALVAAMAELLRVVIVAMVRKKPGAWIAGLGMASVSLSFLLIFMEDIGLLPDDLVYNNMPTFGVLGLILAMSVFLSRNFAETNRKLRAQLVRGQELSDQKLENERRLHEQEMHRQALEADYKLQRQELEEARALQLSMLPAAMPEHPNLEMAAYMQTATEVGGDYYDYLAENNGTLTVAVGDATGHGMKAGTMVTATKSLFNALGHEPNLLHIFDRSTRALKEMNLRKLYMALTLAKFEGDRLRLATAGMPPTLIFRAATGRVEVIRLKGMPLGSFVNFPYREEILDLAPGDTVLFMSDGFPELFNDQEEMLGYDRAVEVFEGVADQAPQAIIAHLVELGRAWTNGRPPDDDMTFVAIKVRGGDG